MDDMKTKKPEKRSFVGYVTKYALSDGIQKIELFDSYVAGTVTGPGKYPINYSGEGVEWHTTYASARDRAEKLRVAKVKSLEKSIAKHVTPFPEQDPSV